MTGFDYTVLVIVILSAMLGWWRGVVYEVLSLMGWIGAAFLSLIFSARLAPYLPDVTESVFNSGEACQQVDDEWQDDLTACELP